MKYMFQFCRILIICFFGETLHILLPLPIPSSVYGLLLLFLSLKTGIIKLEQIRETGNFLTGIFPLLFVPAATGVIDVWDELQSMLIPVLLALFVITALVMAVSGCVTQRFAKKEEAEHNE